MVIHWDIVEAIGTWFSGIITAGTLLFMYVQYHNDKKERLKKEELDGDYEMLQYMISATEKNSSAFGNTSDEDMDEILNSPEHLEEYMKNLAIMQNAIEGLQRQCENFKVRHLTKGMILETQLHSSLTHHMVHFFKECASSPHDMNKLFRALYQKK